jgi:hypothetical protein
LAPKKCQTRVAEKRVPKPETVERKGFKGHRGFSKEKGVFVQKGCFRKFRAVKGAGGRLKALGRKGRQK